MKLIPGWLKKRVVSHELGKLEKKEPMIRKVLAWFTDPAAVGRKRSIALVAALIAGACRGIDSALKEGCEAATIAVQSAWCSVNPSTWATVIETLNGALQVIEPGMDFAAVAFALIGFIDAKRKKEPVLPGISDRPKDYPHYYTGPRR